MFRQICNVCFGRFVPCFGRFVTCVSADSACVSADLQSAVLRNIINYTFNYIIMKTVEEMKMNGEVYEAPQCETIEMQTEGILCSSADDLEDGGAVGWW